MPSEGLTATPLRWQGTSDHLIVQGTGGRFMPSEGSGQLTPLRWQGTLRSVVRELAVTMPSEGLTATPLRWTG